MLVVVVHFYDKPVLASDSLGKTNKDYYFYFIRITNQYASEDISFTYHEQNKYIRLVSFLPKCKIPKQNKTKKEEKHTIDVN